MTDLLLLGAGRGSAGTFTEAEAIYSLRAVDGFSGPVVRLRRHYNSDEQDFTAAELVGEELTSELLANNDMQSSDWANSGGWTFSGGVASLVSTAGNSNFLTLNDNIWGGGYQYYKVTFTIDSCSDFDKVGLVMGTATYRRFLFFGIEAPGTYTVLFDNDERPQNLIRLFANQGDDGTTCSISYFSVKAYSPSAAEVFAFPDEVRSSFTPWGEQEDSAYVRTWYDQSGNGNDAGQSTANAQPKLITAGVAELVNGKPAMVFDGVDDGLETAGDSGLRTAGHSMFTVSQSSDGQFIVTNSAASSGPFGWIGAGNTSTPYSGYGTPTLHTNGALSTPTNRLGVRAVYASGSQVLNSTLNADTSSWSGFNIVDYSTSFSYEGTFQEIIVYDSDQSANRIIIETNINDHYGIY